MPPPHTFNNIIDVPKVKLMYLCILFVILRKVQTAALKMPCLSGRFRFYESARALKCLSVLQEKNWISIFFLQTAGYSLLYAPWSRIHSALLFCLQGSMLTNAHGHLKWLCFTFSTELFF